MAAGSSTDLGRARPIRRGVRRVNGHGARTLRRGDRRPGAARPGAGHRGRGRGGADGGQRPAAAARAVASAAVVVVGVDQAAQLAGLAPAAGDRRCTWSARRRRPRGSCAPGRCRSGAAVVVLPGAAGWLTASMADAARHRTGAGRLVAVVGGSGGVGASTCAAGLALVAAQRERGRRWSTPTRSAAGSTCLLGAERTDGWRWPRLVGARGHLGDLSGQLPYVDGVDVLSVGRGDGHRCGSAGGGASCGRCCGRPSRSHELTVVDLPRAPRLDRPRGRAGRRTCSCWWSAPTSAG